jgi:hypothetical protein
MGYGGDWMGMLLLIALLGGRRGFGFGGDDGGYGGGRHYPDIERIQLMSNENNNTRFNQIDNRFNHTETLAGINGLKAEVGRLGFDNAIIAKNAEIAALECCCKTNGNIDQLRFNTAIETMKTQQAIADCCCTTQRSIDSVNFNNERNTCRIIEAGNNNTQRMMDWLASNELKEAYARIAELNNRLNTQEIVNTVVGTLQPPRAIPAYAASNPYENYIAPVRVAVPYHVPPCNPVPEPRFDNCGRAFA